MKSSNPKGTKRTVLRGRIQRADGRPGKSTDISWHSKFVKLLGLNANVGSACTGCGVGRTTAHEHRYRFPEFAAAWEEALQKGVDRVYSTLLDHAINGVKKPVFHQGKKVGYTTEWDHRSMEWILARRRPAEFGDSKRIELSETRRTVMTPEEEEAAYEDAIQSITATIRQAAMKGIPNYQGWPAETQTPLLMT